MNPSELIRSIGAALAFGLIAWLSSCMPAHAANCTIGSGTLCPPIVKHLNSAGLPQDGNSSGDDTILFRAPTTASASVNFPAGPTPTSPNNGDCWNDNGAGVLSAGYWCHIGGVNVGPLGSSGSGGGLVKICTVTAQTVISGEHVIELNSANGCTFGTTFQNFKVIFSEFSNSACCSEPTNVVFGVSTTGGSPYIGSFPASITVSGTCESTQGTIEFQHLNALNSSPFNVWAYNSLTTTNPCSGGPTPNNFGNVQATSTSPINALVFYVGASTNDLNGDFTLYGYAP